MHVSKRAHFTFSENALVVGGKVARFGVFVAPGPPVLGVHTFVLAPKSDVAFNI